VLGEIEGDCIWQGWRRSVGSSFHKQGAADRKQRLVILKENRVGVRAFSFSWDFHRINGKRETEIAKFLFPMRTSSTKTYLPMAPTRPEPTPVIIYCRYLAVRRDEVVHRGPKKLGETTSTTDQPADLLWCQDRRRHRCCRPPSTRPWLQWTNCPCSRYRVDVQADTATSRCVRRRSETNRCFGLDLRLDIMVISGHKPVDVFRSIVPIIVGTANRNKEKAFNKCRGRRL